MPILLWLSYSRLGNSTPVSRCNASSEQKPTTIGAGCYLALLDFTPLFHSYRWFAAALRDRGPFEVPK
jgi:hypothetical protein